MGSIWRQVGLLQQFEQAGGVRRFLVLCVRQGAWRHVFGMSYRDAIKFCHSKQIELVGDVVHRLVQNSSCSYADSNCSGRRFCRKRRAHVV